MIYQKPLYGSNPYAANIIDFTSFPMHKHCEIEIIYCLEGKLTVDANGEKTVLDAGELVYVGSFVPHSFEAAVMSKALVIEFGHELLKDDFLLFSDIKKEYIKYNSESKDIFDEIERISALVSGETDGNNLDILGSIYKLGAAILRSAETVSEGTSKTSYDRIAPAIRLIHTNYSSKLTIEDACRATSLSAGNFCTLFKSATGMSFHTYLNQYRIRNAGYLLQQTGMSIEEISVLSGFGDIKTFYRVFKSSTGTSPYKFRKDLANSKIGSIF